MQEAIDKLDDRVIGVATQTVVDVLNTCNLDQNQAFIKVALRIALNRMLVLILDDSSGTIEFFEHAIIGLATAPKLIAIIDSAAAKYTAGMAHTARCAAKIMKQEVKKLVKGLIFTPFTPRRRVCICRSTRHVEVAKAGGPRRSRVVKNHSYFDRT